MPERVLVTGALGCVGAWAPEEPIGPVAKTSLVDGIRETIERFRR